MSKQAGEQTPNSEQESDLLDFNWDQEGEHDFFDINKETKPTKTEAQTKLVKEVKKADVPVIKEEGDNTTDDQDDEPDEYVPFSDNEPDEDDPKKKKNVEETDDTQDDSTDSTVDDNTDPDEEKEEDIKFYTELTSELQDKGIFSSITLNKDEQITEERFFELQEQELDSRVDEVFSNFFQELKGDENATALIKYVKAGGKSEDFLRTIMSSPALQFDENLDTSKLADQKKIAKIYLQNVENLDADEVEERIEFLEEKAKLEENSEKWKTKLINLDKKAKEDMLNRAEKAKEEAKTKADELKTSLQSTLDSTESVGVIKFTADDKKTLVSAITKPTIKIGDNRYITSFQSKLSGIMKDPEKLLALAKIIESDLDLKDLVVAAETKVVQKVKSKLNEAKKTKVLKNAGNGGKARSLADMFDN